MKRLVLAAAAVFALTGTAMAHGTAKPAHGGHVVETADGTRVELVQRDGGISVWARDHEDRPIATSKVSGKATLLVGGKKLDLPLKADGDALVADGAVTPADKITAILSLTVDGKAEAARFSAP